MKNPSGRYILELLFIIRVPYTATDEEAIIQETLVIHNDKLNEDYANLQINQVVEIDSSKWRGDAIVTHVSNRRKMKKGMAPFTETQRVYLKAVSLIS